LSRGRWNCEKRNCRTKNNYRLAFHLAPHDYGLVHQAG
jgi:hypothetical protein